MLDGDITVQSTARAGSPSTIRLPNLFGIEAVHHQVLGRQLVGVFLGVQAEADDCREHGPFG